MGRKKIVISTHQTSKGRHPETKPKAKQKGDAIPRRRSGDSSTARAATNVARTKRAERERRIAVHRRKVRLRLMLMVAAVSAVVLCGVSIYRSALFTVETIEVMGNTRLTTEEVRSLAAVPADTTLLRMAGSAIEERVESSPWVAGAVVSREFPDTVRIRVSERTPVALLDIGTAAFSLVDGDGYVLAEQTPEETVTIVVIRDVEDLEPVPGIRLESEALLNALQVWQGLSPEMRGLTRAISAPTVDRTALITKDDVEIFVGSAHDIARKDAVARTILAEQAGTVAYINVRTVDRPTWRGLDSP